MNKKRLYEDTKPSKLYVVFSAKIQNTVNAIYQYNRDHSEELENWREYIEDISNYISHRSIAFDYSKRHTRFPNGAYYIRDLNCNVGYSLKTNRLDQVYVYVFKMDLMPEKFGLKVPPINEDRNTLYSLTSSLNESCGYADTYRYTQTHRKPMKQEIRVSESQFHAIIAEGVKSVLSELDWRTTANYAKGRMEQGNYAKAHQGDIATERNMDRQYGNRHYVNTHSDHQRFDTQSGREDGAPEMGYWNKEDSAWRPVGHGGGKPWSSSEGVPLPSDLNAPESKDIADFVHGRSKYVQGKGWQTSNESLVRESVARAIRKILG